MMSEQTQVWFSGEKINPSGQGKILTTIVIGGVVPCPRKGLMAAKVIVPCVADLFTRMLRVIFVQLALMKSLTSCSLASNTSCYINVMLASVSPSSCPIAAIGTFNSVPG